MRTIFVLLMCVATPYSVTHSGRTSTEDRAEIEGVVLLDLVKNRAAAPLIVVDLATSEVENIRRATAALRNKLMSRPEFLRKYRSWANAPRGSAEFSLTIDEIQPRRAIVLAGTPMIGVSGSRDRFTLSKRRAKWIIIRREANYQVA